MSNQQLQEEKIMFVKKPDVNLTWNAFQRYLGEGKFCDVTLAGREKSIRCHRIVLASGSKYLEKLLLKAGDNSDCVLAVPFWDTWVLEAVIDLFYKQSVMLNYDKKDEFLKIIKELELCPEGE